MRVPGRSAACLWLVAAAAALAAASPAEAQYFGRNRVQYREFDFRVLRTEHFDVYFYPEIEDAARIAARLAERWYARLSRLLGHELRGRQPLILYASHPDFEQTNALASAPGEGTGGVTEVFKRRIVLPFAGPLAETDHVLGHELVHAFQFDITGDRGPVGAGRLPTALGLPLWFIEGMAEYLSLGPVDPQTAMWMRDAATRELPPLAKLDDPRYFPYRYGHALWAYVGGRWGDSAVAAVLRASARGTDWRRAIEETLGVSVDSLSREWHAAIRAAYAPLRDRTAPPDRFARAVVPARRGQRLNVAPSLSPDGRHVAFFSERGLFSVDLYIADTETGAVLRKLTETARDPHLESLLFLQSAGTWSPDGRRFAFGAIRKGRPALVVVEVERGRVVREVAFPTLGELVNPAWSPDGRRIAFSALAGGHTDLFLYDLETGRLDRLTDDPYAELQPAWSPDGRRIAFVTDRFGTDLAQGAWGRYRLAVVDLETRRIEPLPGAGDGNDVNPQWAPDGRSLYFVSDRSGIRNVYRVALPTGEVRQVTDLYTGVSGITPLSPALSVAAASGRLAFNVYADGGYGIWIADDPHALAGFPPRRPGPADPAALPPHDRRPSAVLAYLAEPEPGTPAREFEIADYRAGLSLDYIGQPSLAVGADRQGVFIGGSTSLFWSDMLGNRNLVTMAQVSGDIEDLAAVVGYTNLARRWDWGVLAQRLPFVQTAVAQNLAGPGGRLLVQQQLVVRQIEYDLAGLLAYPFSRVQRVEFQAGVQRLAFDRELDSLVVDRATGQVLVNRTVNLPRPDPLTFGFASAALVYDNSFFGATSPILGRRYRLELGGQAGSLALYTALADVREYVYLGRPFTLAARALHVGRYGGDADDERLFPLFVGYQSLVRGYNSGSFEPEECEADTPGACPAFDRLLGSRVGVANLELRFPPLGLLGLGGGYYGALPLEMALFADAGVAWTRTETPTFLGGDREIVTSAGIAWRFNLFGYAILELDLVKPFDRPRKGWYLQFGFTPGF